MDFFSDAYSVEMGRNKITRGYSRLSITTLEPDVELLFWLCRDVRRVPPCRARGALVFKLLITWTARGFE